MTGDWDDEQLRLPLDLDFDGDDESDGDAYPELPPGWHIVHHRRQLRLAHDLPDIANYQPTT
jgi:hypothetical protein